MNPENYGSLEACQKLHDAGIVVETDCLWFYGIDEKWHLSEKWLCEKAPLTVPALSMAEAWRELPDDTLLTQNKKEGCSEAHILATYPWFKNPNPTDALIDLLLWLRKDRKEEG